MRCYLEVPELAMGRLPARQANRCAPARLQMLGNAWANPPASDNMKYIGCQNDIDNLIPPFIDAGILNPTPTWTLTHQDAAQLVLCRFAWSSAVSLSVHASERLAWRYKGTSKQASKQGPPGV